MYCTDLNALLHRGHVDEAEGGGVAQLGPVLLALHLALLNLNIFAFMLQIILIVKLRQGSGKDRQVMALKAKGLKA